MKWRVLLTAGAVLLFAQAASAQPQLGGARPPTFSPYLNLLRANGSPALNYFGLVRPEVQARQALQNLQTAVTANQQSIGDIQAGNAGNAGLLPTTGHPSMFMNYGSFFLTGGAGGTMNSGGNRSTGRPISSGFTRPQTRR